MDAVLTSTTAAACRDGVAAIAKQHADSSAAAVADALAALSLGRLGSCSLTFRERMEAEEAAFLGAQSVLDDMAALQGSWHGGLGGVMTWLSQRDWELQAVAQV